MEVSTPLRQFVIRMGVIVCWHGGSHPSPRLVRRDSKQGFAPNVFCPVAKVTKASFLLYFLKHANETCRYAVRPALGSLLLASALLMLLMGKKYELNEVQKQTSQNACRAKEFIGSIC